LDNSLTDDGIYFEDNEGEIYQEKNNQNTNEKPNGIS